jgi:predicted nucleic acid-binding protein
LIVVDSSVWIDFLNGRKAPHVGITIRKTIDLLIGTWCIENRRSLLHNDSDFGPMARHLGLIELPS